MNRAGSVSALMIGDALMVAGTLPSVGGLVGGCRVTQDEPRFTVQGSGAKRDGVRRERWGADVSGV